MEIKIFYVVVGFILALLLVRCWLFYAWRPVCVRGKALIEQITVLC